MTAAFLVPPPVLSLDDLSRLRTDALQRLFAQGRVPERFAELNGRPRGRLLAWSYLDRTPLFPLLRSLSAYRAFPWDGKTFASTGQCCGAGVNRLNLLVKELPCLAFKARLKPSSLDKQLCIHLDYSQAGRSWPRSYLHDELREVAPGLYLGPTLLRVKDKDRLLFWFALDCAHQG